MGKGGFTVASMPPPAIQNISKQIANYDHLTLGYWHFHSKILGQTPFPRLPATFPAREPN
jgi:hypothetical protein